MQLSMRLLASEPVKAEAAARYGCTLGLMASWRGGWGAKLDSLTAHDEEPRRGDSAPYKGPQPSAGAPPDPINPCAAASSSTPQFEESLISAKMEQAAEEEPAEEDGGDGEDFLLTDTGDDLDLR